MSQRNCPRPPTFVAGAKRRYWKSRAARHLRWKSCARRWPGRRKFTDSLEHVEMNMTRKTVLITGSTDGVGRYVAGKLAADGANVLIHGRDKARAKTLTDEIRRAGHGEATFYPADLSSLADTRKLAETVITEHKQLDVFISNAGIGSMSPKAERQLSADGHELRFAVNYLSGFLLARLLLPLLKASAPSRI